MGELTIQGVNIGEPFVSCVDNTLTFVMKVQNLDPSTTGTTALPPNSEWEIAFNVMDNSATPTSHPVFVDLNTFSPNTPATPAVAYGRVDPCSAGCSTLSTTTCSAGGSTMASCPAISATETPDGTITIKLKLGTPLVFAAPGAPGVGNAFTWDGSPAGVVLSSIQGNTLAFLGAGAGFLETVQATGTGSYTRVGNAFCQTGNPIAVLTATPTNPVNVNQTVTFNASGSHEPTGACGTINSYTLNFGDGSAPVTQSTPTGGGFSHAYTTPGDYPATLTVKDTSGLKSNTVTDIISVVGTPPPLSSVLSIKTHGTAGTFGVPLQKDAITRPRGVECRTGATSGNHTILFTFQNNLVGTIGTDPGMASVVLGPGSVVPGTGTVTGIGPAQNQYTVNLTGVTNANYVSVALRNVSDTAGHIGDVGTTMGALGGDTNADGAVNSADIAQTKSQSGKSVVAANFREDLNTDGSLNSADIAFAKSKSGTALPSLP
jgi:PKD repeat protein